MQGIHFYITSAILQHVGNHPSYRSTQELSIYTFIEDFADVHKMQFVEINDLHLLSFIYIPKFGKCAKSLINVMKLNSCVEL